MKRITASAFFLCLALSAFAVAADGDDTQRAIAKMLLERAQDDYEIVAKAKAANRGLLERIEQQVQPYLERRGGEAVYNFRKPNSTAAAPSLNEIQELIGWHESAVRRHFYYSEEAIKTGVKLNDALNRMEEFTPRDDELEPE